MVQAPLVAALTLPDWLAQEPVRKPDPEGSRYYPIVFLRKDGRRVGAEDLSDTELGKHCARLAYNNTPSGVAMFDACIAEVKRRGLTK
jgi:hypothetical protein